MASARVFFLNLYQNRFFILFLAHKCCGLHFLVSYSKVSDLEEELKNVTNNLKSLEAQAEKVR